MTAEDWYNEWAFGLKIEWKDLPADTKDYWERAFKEIIGIEHDTSMVLQRPPLGS